MVKSMNKHIKFIKENDIGKYLEKQSLSEYTTYKVGGEASLIVYPKDETKLIELLKYINILMKHELKNALVSLDIHNYVSSKIQINGDINALVQVIDNMISNSIQSYNGKTNQVIDLTLRTNDSNLLIEIQDYGCGMTNEVKDKLFKQMITTKGKKGTGLGLFMSYSTIKAHFNGDIKFESEHNKGTTFTIILPLS